MIPRAHELEDGAAEVVERHPLPALRQVRDLAEIARGPAHANLAAIRATDGPRLFVDLRLPTGSARISYSHFPVVAIIARLALSKRTAGLTDDGITMAEVAEACVDRTASALQTVIRSLKAVGVLRSRNSYIGYQGHRATYYLTDSGVLIVGLTELLGPGVKLQTGGIGRAWAGRNMGEPPNLFQHAALLKKAGAAVRED